MNEKLTEILLCPHCKKTLELTNIVGGEEVEGSVPSSLTSDVVAGVLKCACGNSYPVIDGVPRLLEKGLRAMPLFAESNQVEVECLQDRSNDYEYIRQSFSREWSIFDYERDKTWGWTLEERIKVFMDDVALSRDQLTEKVLLDAGCGNGTLSAALSTLGMQVVGLDLNEGLGKAGHYKTRYGRELSSNVEYVQGNVSNPPLKPGSFDLVYSSGVLHHTPDTKESFRQLVPLVKKGGRMYIWVYGRRNVLVRIYMDSGRQLKKVLSPKALLTTCRLLAPFYKVGTEVLDFLGVMSFRKRTVREITLDLFDAFAPQYNHRHTEEEVQTWFEELGFTNITVSGRQKHGFGVYGDKL
jgi:SAM-dependent methyltransferase/uncharacterized protein YbaR (Trm112 family)